MNGEKQITVRQFRLMVILFTIGSSLLAIPSTAAASAKQGAWIPILVGMGCGCLILLLLIKVTRRYPTLTFVEINSLLLGKWVGALVSLIWIITAFIGGVCTLVYYMGHFITTQIMTTTPAYIVNIIFSALLVMGLLLGLRTVARTAEILFPVVALLIAALIGFVSPKIQLEHFQPVWEAGVRPILKSALDYVSFAGFPLVFFLTIYPSSVRTGTKASKTFVLGSLIGGMLLLLVTAACIGVLGAEPTARLFYPSYSLAKRINIADFITRIEVIVAAIWIITLFFETIVYFYASMKGLAQLLKLSDERALALPLGLLAAVLSLIVYHNSAYQQEWDERTWPFWVMTSGLFFPLLLLAVGAIRKKKIPYPSDR
ncbi:GerAB/ArcD/ProY family transporter [Paenibacillus oleatilyticus]|uniref:Endospore germination permease n=1 Tax=Paenibacillus oleatilyticus TaxID=2594886 RepID=A0ABV4V936_9BACL